MAWQKQGTHGRRKGSLAHHTYSAERERQREGGDRERDRDR